MAATPQFRRVPHNATLTFTNADGTNLQTLITANTGSDNLGMEVYSINVTNEDIVTAPFLLVKLWYSSGGNDVLICAFPIPPGAGINGSSASSLLDPEVMNNVPIDNNGNAFIPLEPGHSLKVSMGSAINPGDEVTIIAFGAEY